MSDTPIEQSAPPSSELNPTSKAVQIDTNFTDTKLVYPDWLHFELLKIESWFDTSADYAKEELTKLREKISQLL